MCVYSQSIFHRCVPQSALQVGESIFNAAADVVDDVAGQYVVNQCENSGGLLDHLANDVMNTYKDVRHSL